MRGLGSLLKTTTGLIDEVALHTKHMQEKDEAEEALNKAYKTNDPDLVRMSARRFSACSIIARLDGLVLDVGLMLATELDKEKVREELISAVDDVMRRASAISG